jgi:hypothetical protein
VAPPRLPGDLSLVALHPGGWRWPLREGDALELWVGSEQIGVLPATVVRELVRHELAIIAEAGRQLADRRRRRSHKRALG